ncbi:sterol desaturase family protein [Arcicella rigui]|uniref:Sterol desaturase family protein n=1 Tax=Arcicella rigui TaxID=797020 RepID=A0ABU5Q806_9BACT|nr:sterol desaturase family protein [Arcicella rigui]MEA5138702.1 sterol desaturase family protein [Arcicella rigui]
MSFNYLAFAVPFFLFLIGLEYWVSKKKGKHFYNFNDTISNLSVGIAERLLDGLTLGLFYFVYDYLYKHFAFFHIQPSVLSWIGLLLITDFLWYWYHRFGHEVNLLWSVHVVHHQSEEFNFTVSARITLFQAVARTFFWSLLPIVGFSAEMITTILLIHGLYPFFTHTRTVGKLGFLEYIFVTPSHHRVHHASNEQYLDKNYSDVFIFWDKIFGTFAEENEEPTYGLTKPLDSNSFLWQHFHFMLEMAYAFKYAEGWRNKLKTIFGRPDNINPTYRRVLEQKFVIHKTNKVPSTRFRNYVVIQMVLVLIGLFGFLLIEEQMDLISQISIALIILVSLVNCGAILEQRRWIFYLEYSRCFLTFFISYYHFKEFFNPYIISALAVLITVYFKTLNRQYLRLIYGFQ